MKPQNRRLSEEIGLNAEKCTV